MLDKLSNSSTTGSYAYLDSSAYTYKQKQYEKAKKMINDGYVLELAELASAIHECACLGPLGACPCILSREARKQALEECKEE